MHVVALEDGVVDEVSQWEEVASEVVVGSAVGCQSENGPDRCYVALVVLLTEG